MTTVADCSGSVYEAAAAVPSTSSAAATQPPDSQPPAATSNVDVKQQRKLKWKPNKAGEDTLFNSWLSSEIEKNQIKAEFMKCKISKISAEKELIELMKVKTSFEIQNMQSEFQPTLFGTELWLVCSSWH